MSNSGEKESLTELVFHEQPGYTDPEETDDTFLAQHPDLTKTVEGKVMNSDCPIDCESMTYQSVVAPQKIMCEFYQSSGMIVPNSIVAKHNRGVPLVHTALFDIMVNHPIKSLMLLCGGFCLCISVMFTRSNVHVVVACLIHAIIMLPFVLALSRDVMKLLAVRMEFWYVILNWALNFGVNVFSVSQRLKDYEGDSAMPAWTVAMCFVPLYLFAAPMLASVDALPFSLRCKVAITASTVGVLLVNLMLVYFTFTAETRSLTVDLVVARENFGTMASMVLMNLTMFFARQLWRYSQGSEYGMLSVSMVRVPYLCQRNRASTVVSKRANNVQ